jgi:hypothetical protein
MSGDLDSEGRMTCFTVSVVEEAAPPWLKSLGYGVLKGSNIAARGSRRRNRSRKDAAVSGGLDSSDRSNPEE